MQLRILQFFQSIRSPFLDILFLVLTISTEAPVIIILSAIMYWCIDKKRGQRILFALVGNIVLNTGIKDFVRAKRPIGVKGIESMRVSTATGYSFPSGHTQTATSFWTSIMIIFKNRYIYILSIIMIIGVGLSRLYLAVHWPIDVIFGWIFGIVFTLILIKIFDYVDDSKNYLILILILVLSGLVIFILDDLTYIKTFGVLTGFVLGYIVEDVFIKFKTENVAKNKIQFSSKKSNENIFIRNTVRFLIGIITLGLVYIGLKYIMPNGYVYDYIRYSIVIFYSIAGVPALFKILKLA